jgi:Holliday junction resolvase
MTINSRAKGNTGELEVARIFRAAGFDCNRVPNSGALRIKGDLYGDLPAHVEVKRGERCRLPEWWKQTRTDAPPETLPVLAWRPNRGEWLAVVPLEALVALLAAQAVAA